MRESTVMLQRKHNNKVNDEEKRSIHQCYSEQINEDWLDFLWFRFISFFYILSWIVLLLVFLVLPVFSC